MDILSGKTTQGVLAWIRTLTSASGLGIGLYLVYLVTNQ